MAEMGAPEGHQEFRFLIFSSPVLGSWLISSRLPYSPRGWLGFQLSQSSSRQEFRSEMLLEPQCFSLGLPACTQWPKEMHEKEFAK